MTILPRRVRAAVHPDRRGRLPMGVCVAIVALGVALAGCAVASTPEQAAEGALRAQLNATIAPEGYRSGALPPELAEAWRSRVANDLGAWYIDSLVRAHLAGTENVTASLMELPVRS